MRVNIWVPDSLIESIKGSALKEKKSVSQYLIDLHRESVKDLPEKKTKEVPKIESKTKVIEQENVKPVQEVPLPVIPDKVKEVMEKLEEVKRKTGITKRPVQKDGEHCRTCGVVIGPDAIHKYYCK